MAEQRICIFCDEKMSTDSPHNQYILECTCLDCGQYQIDINTFLYLSSCPNKDFNDKKHIFSGVIRELNNFNRVADAIILDNYKALLSMTNIPHNINDKLNKIILYVFYKSELILQEIELDENIKSIGYAKSKIEYGRMINLLCERGDLKIESGMGNIKYILTLAGINKAEKLQTQNIKSNQCFVAMWFCDEMFNVFNSTISKAIEKAGFESLIIPMKEFNDDVRDNIIAQIRRSRFIVADFTGQRGGVYFEAGFAYGLGIPVIYSCQEDWFNKTIEIDEDVYVDGEKMKGKVKQTREAHFDVNHFNFIVWKNQDDLYDKLLNRIMATIV